MVTARDRTLALPKGTLTVHFVKKECERVAGEYKHKDCLEHLLQEMIGSLYAIEERWKRLPEKEDTRDRAIA